MRYHFDPHGVRSAHSRLSRLFPAADAVEPEGFAYIVKMLQSFDDQRVRSFARKCPDSVLQTLCTHHRRCPDLDVYRKMVMLFAVRGDAHCSQVFLGFMHRNPPVSMLTTIEDDVNNPDLAATGVLAAARLRFANHSSCAEMACALLAEGKVNLKHMELDQYPQSELSQKVVEFLFGAGSRLLPQLEEHRANGEARSFLERDDEPALHAFLNHYPVDRWDLAFIDALIRRKGAPDHRRHPFYRVMKETRRWSLRSRFFEPRMRSGQLGAQKEQFWSVWLHRCLDWTWEGALAVIRMGTLRILESPTQTRLFQQGGGIIADIAFDHHWESSMTKMLSSHLGWGPDS